jgi:AmmeMemoRadiSam system protein A
MSTIAGFIVPHPPLIVPTIGRGQEHTIESTIQAYHTVSKEIATIKPDTIIFSSPHGTLYRDYFHIPEDETVSGSFHSFGDHLTAFTVHHNKELIETIHDEASRHSFPMGTIGNRHQELDHGVMVPLYFINQYYKDFEVVRVHPSGLSMMEHYQAGKLINSVLDRNEKVVWVASGDCSHKLKKDGPYGLSKEGPLYDQQLQKILAEAAFDQLISVDPHFCQNAAECGHGSFTMMAGAFDGYNVASNVLSYEGPFGVGYMVASFYRKDKNKDREFERKLTQTETNDTVDPYVLLAKKSIDSYIRHKTTLKVPKNLPDELINHKAGVFVSIHKFGRLRGCIGTTRPTTNSIAEEIIENAISASTRDPRFPSVKKNELKDLEISVDVLFPPEKVQSEKQLDIIKYGVIVKQGYKSGLLLPNLDGINSVSEQVSIAKRKAGIRENEDVELYRFEVVRHH